MRLKFLLGMTLFLCMFGLQLSYAEPHNEGLSEEQKTFSIGVLSNKARKHVLYTAPLAGYIASQLKPYGYESGKVKITSSILELGHWLDTGEVDLISETFYSALTLQNEHNGELVLRRWKKGVAEYHTVFFARKDGPVSSLEDLNGKKLILEDQTSTSGFYLPVHELLKHNITTNRHMEFNDSDMAPEVGVVLTSDILRKADEISLSTWVYQAQADAGAFSNLNWDDSGDMPLHLKSEMKIIHRTQPLPRSVVILRKNLPTDVKQSIVKILKEANEDPRGKAVLEQFQKTARFDDIPPEYLSDLTRYNTARLQVEEAWFN
ncbi:phosphate/phosphite/phosphonate ABC transporter substrate-binding protein [Vibrio hangzhouensis]|uniref:phosphate/phosphite/phosphonate ABC transporter substrate-binding protein n=1 Tax=Vibrio hangzhouensis TaxID=462991 RepID=UPI001C9793ED|nr:phosphate/phosphite/phosphonate ABC transporter substrate-binding protein [Vibrio hangzhouensis]MBY6196196.1 phosphate/phosphite/phosphonate ABC transporter substrate-binding protein [Vibrio hangzhouensis]